MYDMCYFRMFEEEELVNEILKGLVEATREDLEVDYK